MTHLTPLRAASAWKSADAGASTAAWVEAGYIIRAHGVYGALRAALSIETGDAADTSATDDAWLSRCKQIQLVDKQGRKQPCTLTTCRLIHGAVLITCAEIVGREAAQLWAGAKVMVPKGAIPAPAEGEAYVYELAGARVQAIDATLLGTVHEVLDNAGQPLLVITAPDGTERLLPLVAQTLHRVDRDNHCLTVRVPEGLWEG